MLKIALNFINFLGTLIRRQRVPLPQPKNQFFYDIIDFNVGKEIEIYGKVFKITDCDYFTRTFLNRLGITVPDPLNQPEDPYFTDRNKVNKYTYILY